MVRADHDDNAREMALLRLDIFNGVHLAAAIGPGCWQGAW